MEFGSIERIDKSLDAIGIRFESFKSLLSFFATDKR
jgi:hypothetical protein